MCIIVFKPKKIELPSDEILKTCFINNPNGAGYMYRRGKMVHYHKGFMDVDKFLESLHSNVTKKDDVCMHFRIATHGTVRPENTHPFPITSEKAQLHQLSGIVNRALCHNGILTGYGIPKSDISDSGFFAKMLYPASTEQQIKAILDRHNTTSKFFVMTGKFSIISGVFTVVDKCHYSNRTYQNYESLIYDDNMIYDAYTKHYAWTKNQIVQGVDTDEEKEILWDKFVRKNNTSRRQFRTIEQQGFDAYLDGCSL